MNFLKTTLLTALAIVAAAQTKTALNPAGRMLEDTIFKHAKLFANKGSWLQIDQNPVHKDIEQRLADAIKSPSEFIVVGMELHAEYCFGLEESEDKAIFQAKLDKSISLINQANTVKPVIMVIRGEIPHAYLADFFKDLKACYLLNLSHLYLKEGDKYFVVNKQTTPILSVGFKDDTLSVFAISCGIKALQNRGVVLETELDAAVKQIDTETKNLPKRDKAAIKLFKRELERYKKDQE